MRLCLHSLAPSAYHLHPRHNSRTSQASSRTSPHTQRALFAPLNSLRSTPRAHHQATAHRPPQVLSAVASRACSARRDHRSLAGTHGQPARRPLAPRHIRPRNARPPHSPPARTVDLSQAPGRNLRSTARFLARIDRHRRLPQARPAPALARVPHRFWPVDAPRRRRIHLQPEGSRVSVSDRAKI